MSDECPRCRATRWGRRLGLVIGALALLAVAAIVAPCVLWKFVQHRMVVAPDAPVSMVTVERVALLLVGVALASAVLVIALRLVAYRLTRVADTPVRAPVVGAAHYRASAAPLACPLHPFADEAP